MRDVAVTEGDKVEAQTVFGWSVNGWGLDALTEAVAAASETEVAGKLEEYASRYEFAARHALGRRR